MTMKIAQEIDVDNVTIIINRDNKLEAKVPSTETVTLEDLLDMKNLNNVSGAANVLEDDEGITYHHIKFVHIKGTSYYLPLFEALAL